MRESFSLYYWVLRFLSLNIKDHHHLLKSYFFGFLLVCMFIPVVGQCVPIGQTEGNSVSRVKRVVGGTPADWKDYPWLGGLEKINRSTRDSLLNSYTPSTPSPLSDQEAKEEEMYAAEDFECSAVLVSENWAMTAAHCLKDNSSKAINKYLKLTFFDVRNNRPEAVTSRFYVRHHNYLDTGNKKPEEYLNLITLPASMINANDIALIWLDRPIKNVEPALIKWQDITDDEIERDSPDVTACGWGKIRSGSGNYPDELQCVKLKLMTGSECNELYNPYKDDGHITISDSELCAADDHYKKDTCEGDSGGPLFQKVKNNIGEDEIRVVGLVSTGGDRCAEKNKPGVYARLSHFEHFIKCFLDKDLECDYVKNFLKSKELKKVARP